MIDTTPLQDRIARALYENAEYYGPAPTQPPWDSRDGEERGEWMKIAAAVLPIIAAEVQAAKAEAWNECVRAAYTPEGRITIDTEALRDAVRDHEPDDHGPGKCDLDDCFTSCEECGEDWPCLWSSLPEVLAAAEYRATRAEAQSAIRGRAVVIYRERAREAEARIAEEKRLRMKATAAATQAEAERDEWRQTALDERGAALETAAADIWDQGHVCGYSDAQDTARGIRLGAHNPYKRNENA